MAIDIFAYHTDGPGSARDELCRNIMETHGGHRIGAGTMLVGPGAGVRDVQYRFDGPLRVQMVEACRSALRAAGFDLDPEEAAAKAFELTSSVPNETYPGAR